jgi:hypothetical protein
MIKDEWRLSGNQANCLHGEVLRFGPYLPPRPGWKHDRCEFCWARFAAEPGGKAVSEGFSTEDRRWICEGCYEDFKILFDWHLEN